MKGIELTIFHHSEESLTLQKVGMEAPLEDCERRKITFYQINAISPYFEEGNSKEFCSIHANGSEYICDESYEKVLERLKTI